MRRFRDCDGDVWAEQSDGTFTCVESETPLHVGLSDYTHKQLSSWFQPLTELDPSPADLSAPATRGDVVRLLRALAVIAQAAPEAGAKYASDLADEIKEGRA